MVGVAKQGFCVRTEEAVSESKRQTSIHLLPDSGFLGDTRYLTPQIMKTPKTPLDIGYRYNGQACHLANHHDLFNLPQDFRQPARASFKAQCQTTPRAVNNWTSGHPFARSTGR